MTSFARLGIAPTTPPMEARLVQALPEGEGWQYEPKWDGFRCLAFRDGDAAQLMSKSGKPLGRYFPEIVAALLDCAEDRLVLDGELVLPLGKALSFADLQLRLHPAASRIARLAKETPARFMLFDCLQVGGDVLAPHALEQRRAALEALMHQARQPAFHVSPMTTSRAAAMDWLGDSQGALDGIVAKERRAAYQPGERAMQKYKERRTADCVVAGFRCDASGQAVASLLLGLYDGQERLHYVGFLSGLSRQQRRDFLPELQALAGEPAFDEGAPGRESRWSRGRSSPWQPVKPQRVVEVGYDQVTGNRFRHGTTFLRWRPDKAARQCTLDQLQQELRPEMLERLLLTDGAKGDAP